MSTRTAANAVTAKARAMCAQMLTGAQYDELLRKKSVAELASFLQERTQYAQALSGVQAVSVHRGQLENLLRRHTFTRYARLLRYAPADDTLYRFYAFDLEIELILEALASLRAGAATELVAVLPDFLKDYASFDIYALAQARSLPALMQVLARTPYAAVMEPCLRDGIAPAACEMALRAYYYRTLLAATGRSQELRELISLRAEAANLHTIYRLKAFFTAKPEEIRRVMLPAASRLRPHQLDALIEAKDAPAFLALLSGTAYGKTVTPDSTFIEQDTAMLRFRHLRHLLHFSTDPRVVFISYLLLQSMETENLIRIIEGVRYGLAPEQMERLLCR